MLKKIMLLMVLISAIFLSGCVDKDTKEPQIIKTEFIPKTNLPAGFSYLGTHDTSIDIGGSSVSTVEGIYRYNGNDIYIQVIKSNDTASLIQKYKDKFKEAKYDPFEEVTFNGHQATQVADYATVDGKQKLQYTIIWGTKEHLIMVGSFSDPKTVISLATATGN